jgi:lysophospholipid acyltransferase (LPLAT)-like uncharacterized protein
VPRCPSSCAGCAIPERGEANSTIFSLDTSTKIETVTEDEADLARTKVPRVPHLGPEIARFSLGQRVALAIVPRIVWALLWLIGLTWHFETIAEEGAAPLPHGEGAGAEIFCFWHQCVLPCTLYFRRTGASILISRSFDGELITRILEMFGFHAVRGSSSRGAREGLLGLKSVIERGEPAIFTADGPRGPIYRTKMGPIKLAQITGARIGAFHLEPEHAWTMRSWDRFLVPKPFTRIAVSWARWTCVATDVTEENFEMKREELNAAIERARLHALQHFGKRVE